jgi:tetratricopeptide (TPR) repeat protein
MIVKNEELLLADCLASVRGVASQLVVVDTGSTDSTVSIAEAAGAEIVDFPWCDDFAAARNSALPSVTGEWILMLDADERLAPSAGKAIRHAIESNQIDCGFLPLLDADRLDASPAEVLSGRALKGDPILLPRLFRNNDDFQWEGIVHESVGTWLERGPKRCGRIEAPLVHYGNVESLRVAQGKGERNYRLLEKQVELQPKSPTARSYLARELIRRGEISAADREIAVGWDCALAAWAVPEPTTRPAVTSLASLRAFRALATGKLETVTETADQLERWQIEHPNLIGMRGMALYRLACAGPEDQRKGLLAAAAQDLSRCLGLHGKVFADEVMPGITSWVSASEMGAVVLLLQEPALALEAFENALSFSPGHREARFGRAEALLDLGRFEDALKALEPLLAEGGADEWTLGAIICSTMGRSEDAQLFMKKAETLGPIGVGHPYRVLRYGH